MGDLHIGKILFDAPFAFLLLLLIPPLVYFSLRGKKPAGLAFSSVVTIRKLTPSFRQRIAPLPLCFRVAALILITVALARPRLGVEKIRDVRRGIAIEMVIDRSGSMETDMTFGGGRMNRLEAVKGVFTEFVTGEGSGGRTLSGRPNDLIGMVAFARYADTICPLTLSHGALTEFLKTVKIAEVETEDGTAIGDAIALAAARLKDSSANLTRIEDDTSIYEIKSKVIILLTDGMNNAGKRSPMEAAELARDWGIRIYAIGMGAGQPFRTVRTPLGSFRVPVPSPVDRKTLTQIAEHTDGAYWDADDEKSLREVYRRIDELEKSEIETVKYADFREAFFPFALAALCLILGEIALSAFVLRRIP